MATVVAYFCCTSTLQGGTKREQHEHCGDEAERRERCEQQLRREGSRYAVGRHTDDVFPLQAEKLEAAHPVGVVRRHTHRVDRLEDRRHLVEGQEDLELRPQPQLQQPPNEAEDGVGRGAKGRRDALREQKEHAHEEKHRADRHHEGADRHRERGRGVAFRWALAAESIGHVVVVVGSQADHASRPALPLVASAGRPTWQAAARVGRSLALPHVGGQLGETPIVGLHRDRLQRGVPAALGAGDARLALVLVGLRGQVE